MEIVNNTTNFVAEAEKHRKHLVSQFTTQMRFQVNKLLISDFLEMKQVSGFHFRLKHTNESSYKMLSAAFLFVYTFVISFINKRIVNKISNCKITADVYKALMHMIKNDGKLMWVRH